MNQIEFTRISKISQKGSDFLDHTLVCFASQLPESEFDMLRQSLETLVYHERMDAACCGMEYYKSTYR